MFPYPANDFLINQASVLELFWDLFRKTCKVAHDDHDLVFEGTRTEIAVDDTARKVDNVKSGIVFKPQKAEYCRSANKSGNESHIDMPSFSLMASPAILMLRGYQQLIYITSHIVEIRGQTH